MSPEMPMTPSDTAETFTRFRRAGIRRGSSLAVGEVARAANADPAGLAQALRAHIRFVTPGMGSKPYDAAPFSAFLDGIADRLDTPNVHLDYFRTSADQFIALNEAGSQAAVKSRDTDALLTASHRAADKNASASSTEGGRISTAVVLGKINSLEDRVASDRQFALARSLDTERIIRHFYVDMGAMTYHSRDTIESADVVADIGEIHESFRPYDEPQISSATSLVISVDARFYRIYAPLMFFYAQQLPHIDMSIVICGHHGLAKELIADGRRYMNALRTLNHSGRMPNVHHYLLPVPSFVAEAKTFYAGARFFAASRLLESYSNLYLMDADLTIDAHPDTFLSAVSSFPFAVPHTAGEAALSPWRRYMAGNVPMNRQILDTTLLDDVQRYLAVGLRSRSSWMLDQNALTYAIESSDVDVADVNGLSRPFRAPSFKVTWEKNFQG